MILSIDKCRYNNCLSINHHFDTDLYLRYLDGSIDKNIRYSVKTAERHGLIFKRAQNISECRAAFDVIENNKKSKDRPQSMSFDQLMDMQKLIEIDYFLVILENNSIASAISYRHNCSIAQVIFLGCIT
jgi:ERCC4-related helicase